MRRVGGTTEKRVCLGHNTALTRVKVQRTQIIYSSLSQDPPLIKLEVEVCSVILEYLHPPRPLLLPLLRHRPKSRYLDQFLS